MLPSIPLASAITQGEDGCDFHEWLVVSRSPAYAFVDVKPFNVKIPPLPVPSPDEKEEKKVIKL